jgi:hypothetical protein
MAKSPMPVWLRTLRHRVIVRLLGGGQPQRARSAEALPPAVVRNESEITSRNGVGR